MKMKLMTLLLILISCSCNETFEDEYEETVRKAVSKWILINSDFPKSYKPISFESYENSTMDSFYKIVHSYYLKSRNNQLIINKHEFVLRKNYTMSMIYLQPTKIEELFGIRGIPPSVFDWSIMFGEKFVNVDLNSHDSDWFLKKYSDYKTIKADKHCSFDYLNNDCKTLLIKSIKSYPNDFTIERVFSVIVYNKLDSNYKSIVNDSYIKDGKFLQTTFFVIKVKNNLKEVYTIGKYNCKNNQLILNEIGSEKTYNCQLKNSKLKCPNSELECFYYDLKWK